MERREQLQLAETQLRKQVARIIQEFDLTISDLSGILQTIQITFTLDQMFNDPRIVKELRKRLNES